MKEMNLEQMAQTTGSGICNWFNAGLGVLSCFLSVIGPFGAGIGVGCALQASFDLDRQSGLRL